MCVGSDFTTFSKIHITLYICSRLQYHAFFEIDISLYSYVLLDGCSSVHGFVVSSDNLIIGLQEIPGIPDRDPASICFYDTILLFSDILMYEVSDLEFSTW